MELQHLQQERTLSVAVEGLQPSVVVPAGHLVSFRASADAIEVLVGDAVLERREQPFVVHVGAGVDVVPTTGKVAEAIATPPLSEQLVSLQARYVEAIRTSAGLTVDNSALTAERDEARAERDALAEANLRLHEEHAAAIALLEEHTAPTARPAADSTPHGSQGIESPERAEPAAAPVSVAPLPEVPS